MKTNETSSPAPTIERDRSHQLILIETMVREGAPEPEIVAAVAGTEPRPAGPFARLRRGLGSPLAA